MGFLDDLKHLIELELYENVPILELCENNQILDVLTEYGFWPLWPWTWPRRSIMTLNLKYVAFVHIFCNLKLVDRRLRNHPDFVMQMGFWPFGLYSGLEGQLWPCFWNLWPLFPMLTHFQGLEGLFWPLFSKLGEEEERKKKGQILELALRWGAAAKKDSLPLVTCSSERHSIWAKLWPPQFFSPQR